ncbi:hypothetical protein N7470_006952 [Penicillium chermesinum]|nr:hypothetical protein N7470_006952 [Penicillium chermesinum]
MRYENWDILLFPEGSRVPIQEFKTQCYVTKDSASPYTQLPAIVNPSPYYPLQGNVGQIPVLTAFVPSLEKDSAFRVSVHSWDKPRPSRFMERMMQPDDVLLFEARVFIDGTLTAGGVFGQRALWPYVIDLDRDGNPDNLRFPAFHPEILEQRHWDAGDVYGRIKRVKDVVSLSFQHAPLHILEYSNIAWPNPSMWSQAPRAGFRYNAALDYTAAMDRDDLHAHSPGKAEHRPIGAASTVPLVGQGTMYNAWVSHRAFPVPASQWPRCPDRRLGCFDRFQEPFMDPTIDSLVSEESSWNHRGARSSREDVPMPDYSSSSSSRAISSMTGSSYHNLRSIDDEQYNELIQALTPTKPPTIAVKGKKEGAKGKEASMETPKKSPKKTLTETPEQVIPQQFETVTEDTPNA